MANVFAYMEDELLQRGREQGISIGEVRGAEKKNREFALRMHDSGYPNKEIARLVNVSIQTVEGWIAEASTAPVG